MYGPTFSGLIKPVSGVTNQQTVLDAAGTLLSKGNITDYYPGCWTVISTLTLNGDIQKAKVLVTNTSGYTGNITQTSPPTPPFSPPTGLPPSPPVCGPIFTDSLQNGFTGSYSWGTYNFSDTSLAQSGSVSIGYYLSNFDGLQIRCGFGNCIYVTNGTTVSFYVNGYLDGGQNIRVQLRKDDSILPNQIVVTAVKETWTKFTIDLLQLANINTTANVIQFQDNDGLQTPSKIYIDTITLNCYTPPSSPTNPPSSSTNPPSSSTNPPSSSPTNPPSSSTNPPSSSPTTLISTFYVIVVSICVLLL